MLLFLIILWPPCHPYIRLCSAIASEWTVCGSQSADRRLRCPPPAAHCSRARRPAPIYLVELASSFLVVSGPSTSPGIGHSFPLGHTAFPANHNRPRHRVSSRVRGLLERCGQTADTREPTSTRLGDSVSLVTVREPSPRQTTHEHCTHSCIDHRRTGSVQLADQGQRGCGQSNNRPLASSEYWSVHWLVTSSRPLYMEAIREDSRAGARMLMMNISPPKIVHTRLPSVGFRS